MVVTSNWITYERNEIIRDVVSITNPPLSPRNSNCVFGTNFDVDSYSVPNAFSWWFNKLDIVEDI